MDNQLNRIQVVLEAVATTFTDTEQTYLSDIFNNPLVVRYLASLSNGLATELINIPLTDMAAKPTEHMLTQAFVKGNFNIIATLGKIRTKQRK